MLEVVQIELIRNIAGGSQEFVRMAREEQVLNVHDQLGYHDAPIMEKLLIENIVTTWLRLQHYEK